MLCLLDRVKDIQVNFTPLANAYKGKVCVCVCVCVCQSNLL